MVTNLYIDLHQGHQTSCRDSWFINLLLLTSSSPSTFYHSTFPAFIWPIWFWSNQLIHCPLCDRNHLHMDLHQHRGLQVLLSFVLGQAFAAQLSYVPSPFSVNLTLIA